jgi:hypothetical protein
MICLRFTALLGPHLTIGPFACFELDGRHVRASAGGPILATHKNFQWQVEGRSFTGWECTELVTIHAENDEGGRSQDLGPFSKVRFADGHCWADDTHVAVLDEKAELWTLRRQQDQWPRILICPVT